MSEVKQVTDEATEDYKVRSNNRKGTRAKATMALLAAFMGDGDDYDTAKGKVKALSQEITTNRPGAKGDYDDGDTDLLKTAVQESILVEMTQAKKDIVLNILNLQE